MWKVRARRLKRDTTPKSRLTIDAATGEVKGLRHISGKFLPLDLAADSFQIVLGLLLCFFRGLFGVGVRLQLMDGFGQAFGVLSVNGLASGYIRAGMHACCVGAKAVEIHSEIVAGVKGSEAPVQ